MNAETFSTGLAHKFFLAAEEQGYTPALMNQLAENPMLIGKFLAVQEGYGEIFVKPLLKYVLTFTVPGRTVPCIPDAFYIGNAPFIKRFGKKIEEPTAETALRAYDLTRPSTFDRAMKEICDEGFGTKTTPGELFSIMEQQPDGPRSDVGPLLTKGDAHNLFQIDDVGDAACLVAARWNGERGEFGGWEVFVSGESNPYLRFGEYRFFSRDIR
jgi:hypothetical protein